MIELQNLTKFRRYLTKDTNLLLVKGEINPVLSGMHVYNSRHRIDQPSSQVMSLSKELLAAVGLAAVSLSERESWGWSLTFPGMPVGFFVGAEPEGLLCLRVKTAETDRGAALIQRQKPNHPLTQSYLEPKTTSPVRTVQQYFEEVEQTKTRLVVREDGKCLLVHALPDGDFGSVSSLNEDELFDFGDNVTGQDDCKILEEVLLFYECRCSKEMISSMIGDMPEAERQDLWGDLPELEIECPRCGREYTLKRTERNEN